MSLLAVGISHQTAPVALLEQFALVPDDRVKALHELVATGWPVLVSLSNKDFVGESLGLPVAERMYGTLAVSALCAWQGARVFRAHNVKPTRQVVDMVAVTRGVRPPARAVRGMA